MVLRMEPSSMDTRMGVDARVGVDARMSMDGHGKRGGGVSMRIDDRDMLH